MTATELDQVNDRTADSAADSTQHATHRTGNGLDIAAVRALFPALSTGAAYLDGAAGTQTPASVIAAIADAYSGGMSNVGGAFDASVRSGRLQDEARAAVADLVGGVAEGVAFGPNMTTLTFRLADAIARTWSPGESIVLTRLDHDANVRPWVLAAARAGVEVRWLDPVSPSLELPLEAAAAAIDASTRLVAMTAASNVVGTRPPVARIAALAHEVGALTYVDGVHATPHSPTDVAALGADLYLTSAYKWAGPHIGAVIADPELLETLRPSKLASSADTVPNRFEWGTSAFADLAGVTAAVEHLAALLPTPATPSKPGGAEPTTRRARILTAMAAVRVHEEQLFARLLSGLADLPRVRPIGAAASRTPTAWFTVDGRTPADVAEHCAHAGVNVWSGHNYAWELAGLLGIRDAGSAVRAGIVHYTDDSDVDRLLAALADIAC